MAKAKKNLRSAHWFASKDKDGFNHRSWMKNQGWPDHVFQGKPVIGICNTWSELTPCNAHFREIAEWVKRGVWEAGGWPLEFPVMSLGETLMRPTTMLYRNLMSMDVEESIRANPLDAVVLLVGCDKTTPASIMGAASCNLPTMCISGGPMLNGKFQGKDIGSGSDVWKFSEQVRAGEMTLADFMEAESCMNRSKGHCMTMGTASTMASMVEALGLGLPTNAAIPAVDARRNRLAHMAGIRAVQMVEEDLRLSKILTRAAFENAIMANAAVGGSTNFVLHLLAIAGRMGVKLTLEDFDALSANIPLLVNLRPNGEYLMEDFAYAGGLPVVLDRIRKFVHADALTVNGKSIGENVKGARCWNDKVIRPLNEPLKRERTLVVLRGNLCPAGAVIKPTAATPKLMKHRGRAIVFANVEAMRAAMDDPKLAVDASNVLVLQGAGPKGYPGMPEVGNFPLPTKLLKQGITDMVRISDARMSGTAYGTVVLHCAPESAVGGPLALVKTGDWIELDVAKKRLHLDVSDAELARRRKAWKRPKPMATRGYVKMYLDHVLQADQGADLDFLQGGSGAPVPRESH